MHSTLGSRRRSSRVLALGFGASVALTFGAVITSCADDPAAARSTGAVPPPVRTIAPAAPAPSEEARAPEPPAVDVAGRVVDDREQAIVGRPIVLVDGRGRRQEVLTDEDGGFRATAVVPPYDVLVDAAPSGAVITPLIFLGLRRAGPRLEVFESQGPEQRPAAQPIRIGVKLPPCRAAAGGCWVTVVTASSGGGGMTAGSYTEPKENAVYDVQHAWHEAATRPDETIDVHVLVGDADYTQYAYAHLGHVAVRPGEWTDLGVATPVPVGSTEPVSVSGHSGGSPEGWQWTLASELEVSGGAAIALRYEWSAASQMRLPVLPGATWRVAAWVQHPPAPERPHFHRSSQAWSGTLPLTTTNVALDVTAVPEPIRPDLEGRVSRRARGIAWDGRAPALASVVLVDVARGQQLFRAFTADAEVPLRRLEALGTLRLEPGEHVLDLTTTPGATVDELAEPDEHRRRDRFDVRVAGGSTHQSFRFEVTP